MPSPSIISFLPFLSLLLTPDSFFANTTNGSSSSFPPLLSSSFPYLLHQRSRHLPFLSRSSLASFFTNHKITFLFSSFLLLPYSSISFAFINHTAAFPTSPFFFALLVPFVLRNQTTQLLPPCPLTFTFFFHQPLSSLLRITLLFLYFSLSPLHHVSFYAFLFFLPITIPCMLLLFPNSSFL